jgi:HlyD family secretion protein
MGLGAILIGGTIYAANQIKSTNTTASTNSPATAPVQRTVTALGYVEPASRVIKLAPPTTSDGGQTSRLSQLLVEEGQEVKKGTVIAILDTRDRQLANFREAEARLAMAEANLAKVQAGAKDGEIIAQAEVVNQLESQLATEASAQMATINRIRAELNNAQLEHDRFRQLYRDGAVSKSLLDSKELTLQSAKAQLQEAQANLARIRTTTVRQVRSAEATLASISEVRPVDVQVAIAEVEMSRAALERAKVNLEQTMLKAPIDGQILKVITRAGETVSNDGIAEIGSTARMWAVLEVYETDIGKVRVGQKVKLFSDSQSQPLTGKVSKVGVKIQRQNVVNSDTSANIDARIVEVRVQLDPASSQQVSQLTNLQVTGEIQL